MLTGLRNMPRTVWLIGAISLVNDSASEMLYPLIPLYLSSVLLAMEMPVRHIFFCSALPALFCLALTFSIREPQKPIVSPPRSGVDWRLSGMPPAFSRYLSMVALFSLGNSSNLFLLLRAKDLGVPEVQIPLLWGAVSAVATLCSTPLSAFSDRVGRIKMLVVGYGAYAIMYACLGRLQHGGPILFLLFACYGIFMAATEGVEKALVADIAPANRRGTAFGWFNLTTGIMILPASLLFGWLYHAASASAAFSVAAACSGLAAMGLLIWVKIPQAIVET